MDTPLLVALAVIAFFGVLGFREGIVKRVIEVAGVVLTLVLSARFATDIQPWVHQQTGLPEGSSLLVTWAALFLTGSLLSRLIASLLSKLVRLTILGWVDRLGGAVLGMAIGTLLASVLLVAASSVPGGVQIQKAYNQSSLGRKVFYAAPHTYELVRGWAGGDLEDIWQRSLDVAREGLADRREELQEKIPADDIRDKAADVLGR